MGDWEVEPVEFEGQQVELYSLITGLRDNEGKLHVVRIAYDAPKLEPEHGVRMLYFNDDSDDMIRKDSLEEVLAIIEPGDRLKVNIFKTDMIPVPEYMPAQEGYYLTVNNRQGMLLTDLYNRGEDEYRLTLEERYRLQQEGGWPDRLVTVTIPETYFSVGLRVYREYNPDHPAIVN